MQRKDESINGVFIIKQKIEIFKKKKKYFFKKNVLVVVYVTSNNFKTNQEKEKHSNKKTLKMACDSLTACLQFTIQQSNRMLQTEFNIDPQPLRRCTIPSKNKDEVRVFYNGNSTVSTNLATLIKSMTEKASELAINWARNVDPAMLGVLWGIKFQLPEKCICNAWIFQHNDETGFLIVPILVTLQPAMTLVDLVIAIGPHVTECCGEPLEIRFFPKAIGHNVLWKLLQVMPDDLPAIIGVNCNPTCNTLVHQLLHTPTWVDIIRIGVVAAQQLADCSGCFSDTCLSTSAPTTPIDIQELVKEGLPYCDYSTHPDLFEIIRSGQGCPNVTQRETYFTALEVYNRVMEVVGPILASSLVAQIAPNIPMQQAGAFANTAMDDFFIQTGSVSDDDGT